MLHETLAYHQTPQDDRFVDDVIKGVRRQQRLRRLILTGCTVVGAVFGAFGLFMVSDSLSGLITGANALPASTALVGVAVFLAWLFQDELSASG